MDLLFARPKHLRRGTAFVLLGLACAWCGGQTRGEDLFVDRVAPIFEQHCLSCHAGEHAKGALDLSTGDRALAGGDSGPLVSPEQPAASLLLDVVTGDMPAMPQDGKPLSAEQIDTLRAWVAAGAPWPESHVLTDKKVIDANWWSLLPMRKIEVPEQSAPWIRTPVDAFIWAALREQQLAPSSEADRRTLIRRLTYDLHGLPPTPAEVDRFLHDTSDDAYADLVDRLLASPRYGERWGRHWLDIVHYGETHGYDKDKPRPHAWPYRDYVIASFNDDKPYDRFVAEQIAGDVLWPDDSQAVVATGFIVAGPWDFVGHVELREGTVDKDIARSNDRDDMVANAMSTFASLTVHCARCHNHKFDPIPQADYYALQAVFAGVDRADRSYDADPQVALRRNQLAAEEQQLQVRRAELEAAREPSTDDRAGQALDDVSQRLTQIAAAREELPQPSWVYAAANQFSTQGNFRASTAPRPVHVLARGDVRSPLELAIPAGLSAVQGLPAVFTLAEPDQEAARRAALAHWLVDPRNTLVRRSIVNRVWQYHFGRGLVDSPNDFGRMGSLPTHPDLLEWLAGWFAEQGHSIKALHRLLLASAVYRQSSTGNADFEKIDAGNRYLWRMNRQRLDAECIRDATLYVAGRLDLSMGGPSVQQFFFHDDHSPVYDYTRFDVDDPRSLRRSVYRFLVRSVPDPFMECLDCADPSINTPTRNTTLTAIQALAVLNNPLVIRQSEHLADRLRHEHADLAGQIAGAYRLALAREPSAEETQSLAAYAERFGLANACRVLLNSNEFMFID